MGHNRGQLPQGLPAAPALPRRARRRPEKTERPHPRRRGHPINHHVTGRHPAPAGLGKPGCPARHPPPPPPPRPPPPPQEGTPPPPPPPPPPAATTGHPAPDRKEPASPHPRHRCTPSPYAPCPRPPHDLLPCGRVKDASGAAMRALRAP